MRKTATEKGFPLFSIGAGIAGVGVSALANRNQDDRRKLKKGEQFE
jgi:hypothetical protein